MNGRVAATRPDKTLADYAGIAFSPILIMALVGSVVFFLLESTYAGAFTGRLAWTMFWFVMASVLVSRISIEKGKGAGAVYGLALAGATALLIVRYIDPPWIPLAMLGFIWWGTSKLVWDCTLIDEDDDSSGEGLLQAGGLQKRVKPTPSAPSPGVRMSQAFEAAMAARTNELIQKLGPEYHNALLPSRKIKGQPHSPGLWLIYFSLVALPLLGMIQAMLPAQDALRRTHAFLWVCLYVAAALGLLLLTSFLGLRRYLRQRYLVMPGTMAAGWLSRGALLAGLVLGVCVLLPRPEATWSVTALVDQLGSPKQSASSFAVLGGKAADGEGRRIGQDPNAMPQNQGVDRAGNQPSGTTQGSQLNRQNPVPGQTGSMAQQAGRAPLRPQPWQFEWSLPDLFRWLVYAVLAYVALRLLWRHGTSLLNGLRELWRDLVAFINRLLGAKPGAAAPLAGNASRHEAARLLSRPFAAFRDPFSAGWAGRKSPAELVLYTYEALEAWARERKLERGPQETPLEFAEHLGGERPDLVPEVAEAVRHYSQLAYAQGPPGVEALASLERLWQKMAVS